MRNHKLAAIVLTATLALASCGGSSGSDDDAGATTSPDAATTTVADDGGSRPEGGTEVNIADFAFDPVELEVQAGDTVTFTNEDDATHTATSNDDDVFDTGDIDGGDTAEITIDEPGEYDYYCGKHEYMKGTIRVLG